MINNFNTVFEAREDRLQIENAFHGECIDFVAKVTTDGVLDSLQYYTAKGLYQAMDTLSADVWYPIRTDISGDCVVLHWTPSNDLGSDSYRIYCLMEKPGETAYPLVWRLNLAYSPGYPAHAVDPIPQQIDFSRYDLLNAPWIEATETDTKWVVDKVIEVPGLDLTSLSTQDIVIGEGSLFDAISAMDSRIDGMNASIEEVSSTALRIESKVDAITIPDDYARQTAINGISATVNNISSVVNDSSFGNEALLAQARDNYLLTLDKTYQIYERIDNATNGLPTIEYKEDEIIRRLDDRTNGLSAIKNELTSSNETLYGIETTTNSIFGAITDDEYGLHNITNIAQQTRDSIIYDVVPYLYEIPGINQNTNFIAYDLVGGLPSVREPAISAAAKATENNALLNDSANGLTAIKRAINSLPQALPTDYAKQDTLTAVQGVVTNNVYGNQKIKERLENVYAETGDTLLRIKNKDYGLSAIKIAIDSIEIPTDYAKQSTLNSVGSTLAQVTTPKVSNVEAIVSNSSYGNQAIKNNVDSAYAKMLAIESLLGDCAEALDIINGEVL